MDHFCGFVGCNTLEPHLCALHQFLEVPQNHWLPAVEGTVLASVKAFYFLHRVRFGGLPEGGLLETGIGHTDLGEDASDSSDLDESRQGQMQAWIILESWCWIYFPARIKVTKRL